MTAEHILFETRGPLGLITLNRPERMNALSRDMILRFDAQLQAWAAEDAIAVVAVRASADKAFCAGGDIRALYDVGRDGLEAQLQFFQAEYRLNNRIALFPKPYVALMDGVVMGGGAGVSVHGRYRVGGDGTRFAMPETAIGLAPDIGASYFLPKLPRRIGVWAGLTGAHLGPAEAMAANVVDYWAPSGRKDAIIEALAAGDYAEPADEIICEILALNSIAPPPAGFKPHLYEIETAFSAPSLAAALERLDGGSDWAREQAALIRARSPFCCACAFVALTADAPDVATALRREYNITRVCLQRDDFYEGVRAAVVDKTRDPSWSPASFAAVDPAEIAAATRLADDLVL